MFGTNQMRYDLKRYLADRKQTNGALGLIKSSTNKNTGYIMWHNDLLGVVYFQRKTYEWMIHFPPCEAKRATYNMLQRMLLRAFANAGYIDHRTDKCNPDEA